MSYVIGTIYKIYYKLDPTIVYVGSTYVDILLRFSYHKNSYKMYLDGRSREISIYPYYTIYGHENFEIKKIKDYLVYRENENDRKHISAYEQLWINKLNCVNKKPAFNPLKYFELREYNAKRKEDETEEEREERLQKLREYSAEKIANETEEERAERLQKLREYNDEKIANETEEERAERLEKAKEYNAKCIAKKIANETEEETAERLEKQKEVLAQKYQENKEEIAQKYQENKEEIAKKKKTQKIKCIICDTIILRCIKKQHERTIKHINHLQEFQKQNDNNINKVFMEF